LEIRGCETGCRRGSVSTCASGTAAGSRFGAAKPDSGCTRFNSLRRNSIGYLMGRFIPVSPYSHADVVYEDRGASLTGSRIAGMRSASAHLSCQPLLPLAQVVDMSQQPVRHPFHIADLDDHFWPTQWTRLSTSGDPKRPPRGGGPATPGGGFCSFPRPPGPFMA
jgi:hypothetical protein